MSKIPFGRIEEKWRKKWERQNLHRFDVSQIDSGRKCYCLVMFSYPSGEKLHMGHWYNFAPADTWARFRRMRGWTVFEPMGFDAFGLPAELNARKTGVHPRSWTLKNTAFMEQQLRSLGAMYDWDYEVVTCEPDYYRWTQWLFLRLYENGLAYREPAPVNWCARCRTSQANEQVIDGRCLRCGERVVGKKIPQWFFRITRYAQALLDGLDELDWPAKTKAMQRNWIGRSDGTEIDFPVKGKDLVLTAFTTRPDTIYGASCIVLAPGHPAVDELCDDGHRTSVIKYREKTLNTPCGGRTAATRVKTGVFTGSYAVNPVNDKALPVWISDYVLENYAKGCVMLVPAHNTQDFEFAKACSLPIRKVIIQDGTEAGKATEEPFTGEGFLVDSGPFSGMSSAEAGLAIGKALESRGLGRRSTIYRLRDWSVSRRRYWGAPIPIVYCDKCGTVPVEEENLPVLLPENVDFSCETGSPLSECADFINTHCPKCGSPARRETDTMDTFVCSSWYFLRYPCSHNHEEAFSREVVNKMLPVDKYIGGAEHACLHLIYARFVTMALYDAGIVGFREPFRSLVHQGVILGADGSKMSKGGNNIITPDRYLETHGSDVLRCYLMFGFTFTEGGAWSDNGIKAIEKFFNRIWRCFSQNRQLFENHFHELRQDSHQAPEKALNRLRNSTIKAVTEDTERFKFNTSISRLMELLNGMRLYLRSTEPDSRDNDLLRETGEDFIRLLAPYAPHLAEELWEMAGHQKSVFLQPWPRWDKTLLDDEKLTVVVQVDGKKRASLNVNASSGRERIKERALTDKRVSRILKGRKPARIVQVGKNLVNIVTKEKK